MNDTTKITLSAHEQELVCNTEWILTKHNIINKVYGLFGQQADFMQKLIEEEKAFLPQQVGISTPKIAKGENYKALPYVMLDYPRCFEKENSLAIRTFFWWGNFFSVSLQLSGKYKETFSASLQNNFTWLQQNDYWVCIAGDPWHHHFETENYLPAKECTPEYFSSILNRYFVKIAKKNPLSQWSEAPGFIQQTFAGMIGLLKD